MPTTFVDIQNAVLSDRFDESQRGDSKRWINHRYGWLCALEPWTFLRDTATVTVTANSPLVSSLPSDFGLPTALILSDGTRLTWTDPGDFFEYYTPTDIGDPERYTCLGGTMTVGPTPYKTDAACILLYEVQVAALSADADEPVIPELFRFALVHGGAAEGLKLQNDPTWQAFEQDFQTSIDAMRRQYMVNARDGYLQYGSWADTREVW